MKGRTIVSVALTLASLVVAGAATTGAGAAGHDLQDVRTATARFHSVAQAEHEGYAPFLDCFENAAGGMGQHYLNEALLDDGGAVDAEAPEALVYEVRDHKLELVAVEYIVNQADVAVAPTLFGHQLHAFGPFYVLHAWVWRDNPTGVHEDWNPAVGACPS